VVSNNPPCATPSSIEPSRQDAWLRRDRYRAGAGTVLTLWEWMPLPVDRSPPRVPRSPSTVHVSDSEDSGVSSPLSATRTTVQGDRGTRSSALALAPQSVHLCGGPRRPALPSDRCPLTVAPERSRRADRWLYSGRIFLTMDVVEYPLCSDTMITLPPCFSTTGVSIISLE